MTVAAISRKISNFGFSLLEKGFALDAKSHPIQSLSRSRSVLMWTRDDPAASLIIDNPPKISDYLYLLDQREYSFLMLDGGIVQVAFTYDDIRIERHRLLYYPCPFIVDPEIISGFDVPFADLIRELYMDDCANKLVMRSPIRFDYAPDDAQDFHPASHITINHPSCRIPVKEAMYFDLFTKFIFENFYPEILNKEDISEQLTSQRGEDCMSEHDKGRCHLNWIEYE